MQQSQDGMIRLFGLLTSADRFHGDRFDAEMSCPIDDPKAGPVSLLKAGRHGAEIGELYLQGSVSAGIPDMGPAMKFDIVCRDRLPQQFIPCVHLQLGQDVCRRIEAALVERELNRALAGGPDVGQSHPYADSSPEKGWIITVFIPRAQPRGRHADRRRRQRTGARTRSRHTPAARRFS